jgi:hypothetical protein
MFTPPQHLADLPPEDTRPVSVLADLAAAGPERLSAAIREHARLSRDAWNSQQAESPDPRNAESNDQHCHGSRPAGTHAIAPEDMPRGLRTCKLPGEDDRESARDHEGAEGDLVLPGGDLRRNGQTPALSPG